jgi:hypothetical protein
LPPSLGVIELVTHHWAITYDETLEHAVIEYPIGDPNFSCNSESFETIVVADASDAKLRLEYTNYNEVSPVVINCENWRNPTSPEVLGGFSLITYTGFTFDKLDYSSEISIDGTNLEANKIDDENLEFHVGAPFPSESTYYTIAF